MLRHNWVELKDGVLREYPVYRCAYCMTIINYRELLNQRPMGREYQWSVIHKLPPDTAARHFDIDDDCELQLVKNVTED